MKLQYCNMPNDLVVLSNNDIALFEVQPWRMVLCAGLLRAEVRVEFSPQVPQGCLCISEQLFEGCRLPPEVEYQIKTQGRMCTLGPVIAFVPFGSKRELEPALLDTRLPYFGRFEEIGGLVYICTAQGFSFSSRTVTGYAYVAHPQEGANHWVQGTFPMPCALYRRVDLPDQTYRQLIDLMGNHVFNGHFFTKYEMWQYLSGIACVRGYLPETALLQSLSQIDAFLQRYPSVYLKPVDACRSQGLYRVQKMPGELYVLHTKSETETVCTRKELEAMLEEQRGTPYLCQQGLCPALYEGRHYDFRVIMQKGQAAQWECTGIMARFGKPGAATSNFSAGGCAMEGFEALCKVFSVTGRQAFVLRSEIVEACKRVCSYLDACAGNYGDVGLDVLVDKDKKVWVLEVNKLHDHTFPLSAINDTLLYEKIVTQPLFYAKTLAGF